MPEEWPAPADAAAAERLLERFVATGRAESRLAADPGGRAMLRCLGGNSPFLADLAVREAASLCQFAQSGPDLPVQLVLQGLAATAPTAPRDTLAATLRTAKRVVALLTALADIGGVWDLDHVTAALSTLAETALRLCVAHLLRQAHEAGTLRLPHPGQPERDCGFVVLGMGKLGARELNYSSDVDLVLLHDPGAGVHLGDSPTTFYTRMSHSLASLMEARDAGGYVFRVDLRLRPDPGATPACVSLPAAISYYESLGQNWERAAMLKARPVAGDLALGAGFLQEIRPFVWRRHLDFAAIADIRAMKQRIDAVRLGRGKTGRDRTARDPVARLCGLNVKLGHGGIREIEFLTQTLQLVWGGREPALRASPTREALGLLARAGHLSKRAARELTRDYEFLRRVEHRLQMVADRQTHSLPDRVEGIAAFAGFLGYADAAALAKDLWRHLDRVQRHYLDVFQAVPAPEGRLQSMPLDFTGQDDPPPETTQALREMGFVDPARIVAAVRGWRAGRVRSLRSQRARELILTMLPELLASLARHPDPDLVFSRFDVFLSALPTGVQLLSLFQRNPALLDRVAGVLGAAPPLAEYLTRTPQALEGLLRPAKTANTLTELRRRLADADDLEMAIDVIRAMVREEEFSLSVATMEGRLDADQAGEARSRLADAALTTLLPRVLADFASRFGRVRGGGMAVVLLGKAGSREMMAGSDLDLMFIYDHPAGVLDSGGARRLPASQWFIRAVHAFVAALTAPDAAGPMFAVDMRLRPSGNKGPVAVSLAAFEHYHAVDRDHGGAWTWERMALTRARVVAGPVALRRRVEAAIRSSILHAAEPGQVRADAADMRARLLRDLPPSGPWDIKLRPGGQIEVEFVAQALQLIHARAHPEVLHANVPQALRTLGGAGLITAETAGRLILADLFWRTMQGILRITGPRIPPGVPAEGTVAALIEAAGRIGIDPPPGDPAALRAAMERCADEVHEAFVQLIGETEK